MTYTITCVDVVSDNKHSGSLWHKLGSLMAHKTIPYVYKWTHLPTGKWYIGSKIKEGWNPLRHEEYICSSKTVKPMIIESRNEWSYEIIATGAAEEMIQLEITLLKASDAKNNPLSFNQHNGDGIYNRAGATHTSDTKSKMSLSHKNQVPWNKGKELSSEYKEKIAEACKDRPGIMHSDEAKKKIAESAKGRIPWNKGMTGSIPWNKGCSLDKSTIDKQQQAKRKNGTGSYEKICCATCGKTVDKPNFTRWHGANCKLKS